MIKNLLYIKFETKNIFLHMCRVSITPKQTKAQQRSTTDGKLFPRDGKIKTCNSASGKPATTIQKGIK